MNQVLKNNQMKVSEKMRTRSNNKMGDFKAIFLRGLLTFPWAVGIMANGGHEMDIN